MEELLSEEPFVDFSSEESFTEFADWQPAINEKIIADTNISVKILFILFTSFR